MEQNELVDQIAYGTQESTSSVDCGTANDVSGDIDSAGTEYAIAYETLERATLAHDCAVDALSSLRRREEKAFRDRHGWGPLLRAFQYAAMNRYVDAVVIVSEESRRVRETRSAMYAASARLIETREAMRVASSKGGSR